jgi:hypothetical protein
MTRQGSDKGCDSALHVNRASAVKHTVFDVARKRRMEPIGFVAGRYNIDMAGKHQVRTFGAKPCIEIVDISGSRLGEYLAFDREAEGGKPIAKHIQDPSGVRSDRRAADKAPQDLCWIGELHASRSIVVTAFRQSSFLPHSPEDRTRPGISARPSHFAPETVKVLVAG